MTRKQSEILDFVKGYTSTHGYSPTYQEIADAKGLSSLATVHKHLYCLKAQGRITLGNAVRSITIITEPADDGRFEFEEPNRLWDRKLKCYWVREVVKNA
jgi:repressor LexA